MVVISIMAIVSGVMLYNYQDFNSTTLVTNYAYEVAYAIREAQVYGVSVSNASNPDFKAGYGIHFGRDSLGGVPGVPASFTVFVDSNGGSGDNHYQEGEKIKDYTFNGAYRVDKFCAVDSGGTSYCSGDGSGDIKSLDITFLRPNPDATIKTDLISDPTFPRAIITVRSPSGTKTKDVDVFSTGQISIQDTPVEVPASK